MSSNVRHVKRAPVSDDVHFVLTGEDPLLADIARLKKEHRARELRLGVAVRARKSCPALRRLLAGGHR
jgi:hypothetical protein